MGFEIICAEVKVTGLSRVRGIFDSDAICRYGFALFLHGNQLTSDKVKLVFLRHKRIVHLHDETIFQISVPSLL